MTTRPALDSQTLGRRLNELLVLSLLRRGPMHGYQVSVEVEERSGGFFTLGHGTLYPILHRLEEDGLIRGSWSKKQGRRRKVYALTRTGERYLSGGSDRVEEITFQLMRLLKGPEEAPA